MTTYYGFGDAIEGKRIACQFRRIKKVSLIRGTSSHRARRTSLDDAYCVVVTPITKA